MSYIADLHVHSRYSPAPPAGTARYAAWQPWRRNLPGAEIRVVADEPLPFYGLLTLLDCDHNQGKNDKSDIKFVK